MGTACQFAQNLSHVNPFFPSFILNFHYFYQYQTSSTMFLVQWTVSKMAAKMSDFFFTFFRVDSIPRGGGGGGTLIFPHT